MATELKKSNRYWISKERQKELEWFCKQYHDWQLRLNCVDGLSKIPQARMDRLKKEHGDPTAKAAEVREYYISRMDMVRRCCYEAGDSTVAPYIFKAVTNGLDYDKLNASEVVPVSRRAFYQARRCFFWHLSCARM